ncbi:hypothetical protein D621_19805 [beta proteobacterium AAP51]|nr:hypothetical protein D621_19805 [beta proteobacterium AAP51]
MLRAAALLLVLANLAFFAWTRGWLEPGLPPPRQGQHEPQRLAAQVNAPLVTVLPARAASAAVVAARAANAVCLEAGPLAAAELPAAEAELQAAQLPEGSWAREAAPLPPLWLVYAGRYPEAAARRTREAALHELGLNFELLNAPAELAPGLVVSRHATRAEAETALARLTGRSPPLRGARVAQLPAPPAVTWLRVARADAELQARLKELPAEALAGGFKPCPVPARS